MYVPCVCVHVRPTSRRARLVRWLLPFFTHTLDTPGTLSDGRTHGRDGRTGRMDKRKDGRTDGRTDARTHARTQARTDGRDKAELQSRRRPLITLCSLRSEATLGPKATFYLP